MPTNNGNVTRAAVGVAKRLSDANFNANVKPGVLGVKHYGAGRQGQAGRGRQAGAGRGKRKAPGEMPGAVIGAGGVSPLQP